MNKLNYLKEDYFDFVKKGKRYYRVFYNIKDLDKKFICGQVIADKGTRFIAVDFYYSDGTKTKAIVPDDANYKSAFLCLVDSETFYDNFVPYRYIEDDDKNDLWVKKWENIVYIKNHIYFFIEGYIPTAEEQLKINNCTDPHDEECCNIISKYEIKRKEKMFYMLENLSNIAKNDKIVNDIITETCFNDNSDDNDIIINRHNLYFLDDNDINHLKDIVDKLYKEVINNE